ncbi:MAG TPA: DUF2452 domain-containing protein [Microscillaceae bacterium]|nr:DUF2452 domain-containing protein [Microscillaceae bacterium]
MEDKKIFENPTDKDKVTDRPGILPQAPRVGEIKIVPTQKGQIQGRAIAAMEEQTDIELAQIQKQVELLVAQAKKIQERVEISRTIHNAEMGFQPKVGREYHLYQKENGEYVLSIIAPQEWKDNMPYNNSVASVRLLADHTWEVLD